MAAFDVLSFNSSNFSGSTMRARWDPRDAYDATVTAQVASQFGGRPKVTGLARDPIMRVVRVERQSGTLAAFMADVEELFTLETSLTPRDLKYVAADGATTVKLSGFIVGRSFRAEHPLGEFWVTMLVPDGIAVADTPTTPAANPATVTNAGSIAVAPVVTLTTGTHVTYRACTVADTSTRGLSAYPVRFDLSDANATTTNTLVFVQGKLVSSWVEGGGTASSRVWCLIDAAADGSVTNVDIFYGTGLTNPLGQTFTQTMIDFGNATNSQWRGTSTAWNVIGYPEHAGVWRPARTGNHNPAADNSYTLTTSGTTAVFSNDVAGVYPPDGYDSLVMSLGGAQTNTTNAVTIRRVLANFDATPNARAFIRYRTAGSADWLDAWTSSTNATVTTAVDIDNAVELAIGFENHGATADPLTLTVGGAAPIIELASTPTVVVGAAANYDRYDGTYTIGAYTLTFNDLLVPDGTLTIDCAEKDISSSASGRFFWIGESMVEHSDPVEWLLVASGVSTVTDSIGATDTISFRAGFGA